MPIEIHEKEPEGFSPRVEVSACYLEADGKLLLLQQAPNKLDSGKWGVPGGKFEKGETPESAAIRELFEETGISLNCIQWIGVLYIRKAEVDFVYHLLAVSIDRILEIRLSKEHQDYKWASSEDLKSLPLRAGGEAILRCYRNFLMKSTHT